MPQEEIKLCEQPVTLIGLGGVGRSLARSLHLAAFRHLTLVGKGRAGEQKLSLELNIRHPVRLGQLQQKQGFIVLALKESDLAAAVQSLTRLPLPWAKLTVLHTSGSLGADILLPLATLGAGVAAWHPYQTFPRQAKRVNLAGVTFGIDGNRKGILVARRLTRALGGVPLKVSGEDRVLYHLSAVLACGFVAADLQMAVEVLKRIGIPEKRALQAVLPIARETLTQVEELGTRAAMTGPAVRGDQTTIRKHLAALKKSAPDVFRVYKAMTEQILASVRK